MFNWMKKHKKLIAFITFMIIFGIPFIIHILFKLHSNIDFFVAEWTAGELLSYYGSILAFLGTVILGALSLYQNQIIKQESDKRTALLEQREHESNMPRFSVVANGSHGGNAQNLCIKISNVSENNAQELKFFNIKILNPEKEPQWVAEKTYSIDYLFANSTKGIDIFNPIISNGFELYMEMTCLDKYNEQHNYIIKGLMNTGQTFPALKIIELS